MILIEETGAASPEITLIFLYYILLLFFSYVICLLLIYCLQFSISLYLKVIFS